MNRDFSLDDLNRIAASVGERSGWDFSQMRVHRDPVPWEYHEVVRPYLHPTSQVLDIGTGGGERFLAFNPHVGRGVGIDPDPDMIETARRNLAASGASTVSFELMEAKALAFDDAAFDVVLNRHAPVDPGEVIRVLEPGGVFITQQVGSRNTQNICATFGCGPFGTYEPDPDEDLTLITERFLHGNCTLVARGEYDVPYRFLDIESLIFWLKAIPLPADFDMNRHWQKVTRIVRDFGTSQGIETNEHRELLILREPRLH